MAVCKQCRREMKGRLGCIFVAIEIDGVEYKPIPHDGDGRCHDCNTPRGGIHHPGCDAEECPKCHGQLISCGCLDDEDDDDE